MPTIMTTPLLRADNTGIVILDVQEKLMPVMARKERAIDNILKLIHLSKLFNLPVILAGIEVSGITAIKMHFLQGVIGG